jgi:hypothetical protein
MAVYLISFTPPRSLVHTISYLLGDPLNIAAQVAEATGQVAEPGKVIVIAGQAQRAVAETLRHEAFR